MEKQTILVIEDEQDIVDLIKLQGEVSGFHVIAETDGLSGYLKAERERPDVILLDIMLPGLGGLEVCRKLKNHPELKNIPIIMISAKSEEVDVVLGLELGADDYVTKPFSPKVLFSRVKAVLRRGVEEERGESSKKVLKFGQFEMDGESYQVKKRGKLIALTLSEFGILYKLANSRGKVLTRNQLLDDLHQDESYIVDRNIDVHIAALRRKLGPNFKHIDTVRGVGYRFVEEEDK